MLASLSTSCGRFRNATGEPFSSFAGDSDFHEAIQHLVEHEDVNLVLIGTLQTISQELRPYARNIVELDKQSTQFSRP